MLLEDFVDVDALAREIVSEYDHPRWDYGDDPGVGHFRRSVRERYIAPAKPGERQRVWPLPDWNPAIPGVELLAGRLRYFSFEGTQLGQSFGVLHVTGHATFYQLGEAEVVATGAWLYETREQMLSWLIQWVGGRVEAETGIVLPSRRVRLNI